MKIAFISNYINHHQIPFCNACYEKLNSDFIFIQTEEMEEERVAMGWHRDGEVLPYVRFLYKDEEACRRWVMDSDILLAGWTDREDLIGERLKANKPVIRISERLYREGQWKAVSPKGLIRKYQDHTRYRNQKAYLLCAGAYVASDFHLVHAYPDKMYRWGYFPETRHYKEEEFSNLKSEDGCLHIVWAGRFIPLKHPEFVIRLAAELKKEGYPFRIHMVGSGELEEELKRQADRLDVSEQIRFYGFRSPEEVRRIMESCQIHLFTSNHLEGWGAVINEAMNSGCVPIANIEAGAVPYLIRHKQNGMIYRTGSFEDMLSCVRYVFDHETERKAMAKAAYETIVTSWNAEHAAEELLRFSKEVLEGNPQPAAEGPLSTAPVIAPGKMEKVCLG